MKGAMDVAIEVFNRYENKYLLDEATYQQFYDRLLHYMEPDANHKQHPFYSISNIYFDTKDDELIRKSISKPKFKEKLRLRTYGVPEQNAKAFLELKKKVFGLVNKRRTALRIDEAYQFVRTGVAPELKKYMNQQVLREIQYFLQRYELEPKVYLAYERRALFWKESRDLRITFDTNIRSRRYDIRPEAGDHGDLLLESGQWLMEVKAEKTIPFWLSRMLSEHRMFRKSFSKYGTEYKRYITCNNTRKEEILYA